MISQLIKWTKMITGKSVFHIKQSEGQFYSLDHISGYYSDLRHKVLKAECVDNDGIPYNITSSGKHIYFPITIFQYGLGAYDLYLESKDIKYYRAFMNICDWTLKNLQPNGGIITFDFQFPSSPYSSMAQGECASLLSRAYYETNDSKYYLGCQKAIEFMLTPSNQGGTLIQEGTKLLFEEHFYYKGILNGMVFSIWGLWDYYKISNDSDIKDVLHMAINSVAETLISYDRGYWSNYDKIGSIASPFYHDLLIHQLYVLAKMSNNPIFEETAKRWSLYQASYFNKTRAIIVKAYQKLFINSLNETLIK